MHTDDFCMALMIAQHLQNNSSSAVSCWNPRAIWNANFPWRCSSPEHVW